MQYDFRSVYASLLENWLCVKNSDLQTIMLKNFQNLGVVNSASCKTSVPNTGGFDLITNDPNPFVSSTTIRFKTNGGHTLIQIMDTLGRVLATPVDKDYSQPGSYSITFNSGALAAGVYYARLQNGTIQQVRTMLKGR